MNMDGSKVDTYSARLSRELSVLSWQDRNELLVSIGRQEMKMLNNGQERPVWRGPLSEDRLLGVDVVVPTAEGERRGRVICYGVVSMGANYERSVVIHVASSGTHHEAPASVVRLASPEDLERIRSESEMADRLREAALSAEKGPKVTEQAAPTKKRGLKDPVLVARMVDAARTHPNVSSVEEGGANFKVVGRDGSKRLYVFKTQLRVDVSGFSFDHPGLRRISDDEARDMHLGKVRGQVIFGDREVSMSAFEEALNGLK